jgi:hypothetical protein
MNLCQSLVSVSEEIVYKNLGNITNLFRCFAFPKNWIVDSKNSNSTSAELYFDQPKWARETYVVKTEIFDFSVLMTETLKVIITGMPKTTIGVTLINFDKLHATSGNRFETNVETIHTKSEVLYFPWGLFLIFLNCGRENYLLFTNKICVKKLLKNTAL